MPCGSRGSTGRAPPPVPPKALLGKSSRPAGTSRMMRAGRVSSRRSASLTDVRRSRLRTRSISSCRIVARTMREPERQHVADQLAFLNEATRQILRIDNCENALAPTSRDKALGAIGCGRQFGSRVVPIRLS